MKGLAVGTALLAAVLAAAPAGAQQRRLIQSPDFMTLVGPGSSIGVRVRDVNEDDLKKAKLDGQTGVYIVEVERGSPAERAGLKEGDILTEFDGERVRSVRGLTRLVSETPPDRTVKATIVRDASRRALDVTPENSVALNRRLAPRAPAPDLRILPRIPRTPAQPDTPRFQLQPPRGRLGVTLGVLDGQMAEFFGVSRGVLVSAVERDSPAARAGLKAGDVITDVNGRPTRQPADVSQAVRDAKDSVELKIVRDKKEMTLRVPLDAASDIVRLPV
jgi:serine protease Do